MHEYNEAPTAAVLLIGNELLSGRTQDLNLAHIAKRMVEKGIRVLEARVVTDDADVIKSCINELRSKYTYVFTTGGIGPTHDDITADCVAAAFGVDLPIHQEAEKRLLTYFKERDIEPNSDRMRMARIPLGASLVDNPVSVAPGFQMGNVFVFAGVPRIMQAMLDSVMDRLKAGKLVHSVTVICHAGEGAVATPLRELQEQYPKVDIGCYPGKMSGKSQLSFVARGTDEHLLESVRQQLVSIADSVSVT